MKKFLLHHVFSLIKKGLYPSKISRELNISKQKVQYYVDKLKKEGKIEKVSYGIWKVKEVQISSKARLSLRKQIRGHAFNWKVKFLREYDWLKLLNRNNLPYNLIGINKSTPRILINEKKVWLTKNGLVIYEPQSFFARTSRESFGLAVYELQQTVRKLERMLHKNLGTWQFTVSREHYGMIKNELARQYNEKGEKLYVRDEGGIWMWIDDSYSLDELETNNKEDSSGVQTWYNSFKEGGFKQNAYYIEDRFDKQWKIIEGLTNTQVMNAQNIIKHQKVLDDMLITLKAIRDNLGELKKKR